MHLDSSIEEISGIGPKLYPKFVRLGIKTIDNLINYYPRRYDDYSTITKINQLKPGACTIEVKITSVGGRYLRRGMHLTEAIGKDATGSIKLIWFNQSYRAESLHKGSIYYVSGDYQLSRQQFSIINPSIELKNDFPLNTARILPKYKETKGLSSRDIRKAIRNILPLIKSTDDNLPKEMCAKFKLLDLRSALELIHFPNTSKDIITARNRLAFNEVFELMLASHLNKQSYVTDPSLKISFQRDLAVDFVKKLPFKLTDDQRRAIWQIYLDMSKTTPMNRLIEGDVGSGKTVVATMAALMVINEGKQVAFMAPTELLARQHAETIYNLLKPLGLQNKLSLIIGGMNKAQKLKAQQSLFIIGTHALISEDTKFNNLALVIIDEQHRFGVKQRKELRKKANFQPHLLTLSATPIPRSLALTMFGELDISRLSKKPSDRQKISTKLVSLTGYEKHIPSIKKLLDKGEQMYVVCSTIESEAKSHSLKSIYQKCQQDYKGYKVGMIHGQMSSEEKEKIMKNFQTKRIDILVATTLIEVGIDVASANVMVIMSSDNFGLAQLHQLRGRIGRGNKPGICYLVYDKTPSKRLRTMESCDDGFKLAEIDLEIRGPGAIYGDFQHGLLDLRLAELSDTKLLKSAREAVKYFSENSFNLVKYRKLEQSVKNLQKITNLN